ncbi:MAG: tRNA (guanosine(37)-N1)-methyltransferase TrmD [Patescibacteria group bacterium]
MQISVLTLFPNLFRPYLEESILRRAVQKKIIDVHIVDIRQFATDKHNTADDKPYGGGAGMVMKADIILRAFDEATKKDKIKPRVIMLSAAGDQFTNIKAKAYAKSKKHVVLIAGHYEGIDERVKIALKAEEISVGPYVLTGGELPALVIVDAIARQIVGVLGNQESVEELRYGVGIPTYTRPEVVLYKKKKYTVPPELLSGDHKKIEEWRQRNRKK